MLQEGSTILQGDYSSHTTLLDTGQSTVQSKKEQLSGIVPFYDECTKEWSERLFKHAITKKKDASIETNVKSWFTVGTSKCVPIFKGAERDGGESCETLLKELTDRIKKEVESNNLIPPSTKSTKAVDSTTESQTSHNETSLKVHSNTTLTDTEGKAKRGKTKKGTSKKVVVNADPTIGSSQANTSSLEGGKPNKKPRKKVDKAVKAQGMVEREVKEANRQQELRRKLPLNKNVHSKTRLSEGTAKGGTGEEFSKKEKEGIVLKRNVGTIGSSQQASTSRERRQRLGVRQTTGQFQPRTKPQERIQSPQSIRYPIALADGAVNPLKRPVVNEELPPKKRVKRVNTVNYKGKCKGTQTWPQNNGGNKGESVPSLTEGHPAGVVGSIPSFTEVVVDSIPSLTEGNPAGVVGSIPSLPEVVVGSISSLPEVVGSNPSLTEGHPAGVVDSIPSLTKVVVDSIPSLTEVVVDPLSTDHQNDIILDCGSIEEFMDTSTPPIESVSTQTEDTELTLSIRVILCEVLSSATVTNLSHRVSWFLTKFMTCHHVQLFEELIVFVKQSICHHSANIIDQDTMGLFHSVYNELGNLFDQYQQLVMNNQCETNFWNVNPLLGQQFKTLSDGALEIELLVCRGLWDFFQVTDRSIHLNNLVSLVEESVRKNYPSQQKHLYEVWMKEIEIFASCYAESWLTANKEGLMLRKANFWQVNISQPMTSWRYNHPFERKGNERRRMKRYNKHVNPPNLDDPELKTIKIRLYPTPEQGSILSQWISTARWIYNRTVEFGRTGMKTDDLRKLIVTGDNYDETNQWVTNTPSNIRDGAFWDYIAARKGCRTRKKNQTITHYFIKYKSKRDGGTIRIYHNEWYQKRGKYAFLKDIPTSEQVPPIRHDFTISLNGQGEFNLLVPVAVVRDENQALNHALLGVVSLDPGVRTFQTTFDLDGNVTEWGRGDMTKIGKMFWQIDCINRKMGREALPNRKIKRLRRVQERLQRKIRNKVDDLHRKLAKWLCSNYQVILLPTFETKKMAQKRNRKLRKKTVRQILTWSHYRFQQFLLHKAREYPWVKVYLVNEAYTSKTCTCCGTIHNKLYSNKIFNCPDRDCRMTLGRDCNGARNILLRFITTHEL